MSYIKTCQGANASQGAPVPQANHKPTFDSDSDDQEDFDQYSELDAFDTEEVEVSPDDEQALAAFMVSHYSSACIPTACVHPCDSACTVARLLS